MTSERCEVCGLPVRRIDAGITTRHRDGTTTKTTDWRWLHEPPYDPFDPPIHAPRAGSRCSDSTPAREAAS